MKHVVDAVVVDLDDGTHQLMMEWSDGTITFAKLGDYKIVGMINIARNVRWCNHDDMLKAVAFYRMRADERREKYYAERDQYGCLI